MTKPNKQVYYTYWEVSRKLKSFDKLELRLKMVNCADTYSISAAARYFKTDRKTVRKWYRRWKEKGIDGLRDLSRRPKSSPNKLSDDKIKEVIKIKKKFPTISTKRLAAEGLLPCSHETARKYAKEAGLIRKHRKRVRIKRKVALEFKQNLKPFELMQLDTKHLYDMPHYAEYMNALGLPQYEYTLRDVKTGLVFTSYARELSLSNNITFLKHVIYFLEQNGVNIQQIKIQYDNGSENIGSVHAKSISELEKFLESKKIAHKRIPYKKWSYNSDVETFHGIIENEFFEIEHFYDISHFFKKAAFYNLFFNNLRRNSYKNYQTPVEMLKKENFNPALSLWIPLNLDKLTAFHSEILHRKLIFYCKEVFMQYFENLCYNLAVSRGGDVLPWNVWGD